MVDSGSKAEERLTEGDWKGTGVVKVGHDMLAQPMRFSGGIGGSLGHRRDKLWKEKCSTVL